MKCLWFNINEYTRAHRNHAHLEVTPEALTQMKVKGLRPSTTYYFQVRRCATMPSMVDDGWLLLTVTSQGNPLTVPLDPNLLDIRRVWSEKAKPFTDCFSPWRPGGLPYWTHKLSYPSSGASLQSNRHFGLGAQLTQQAGAAGGLKSQGPLEGNHHEITSEPQSTTSPIDHWHMPKDPSIRPQILHGSMMTPTVRNGGMYITWQ